ncbi:MAG: manganese transport protein [Verrucomicrobiales bacterium]|jgi:manganese transport protein
MSTSQNPNEAPKTSAAVADPYALSPDRIEEPPTSLGGKLRHLGPGFILSASIVGSGELIATTVLGAQAGFICFWVVIVSCLVKVTLQLEFGKHAIQSGESTFASFNKLPGPKIGHANWSTWGWFVLMLLKFLQVGGIVGGVAIILQLIKPITTPGAVAGSAGADLPVVWTILVAISVSLLVFRGYYKFIEKASIVMIGLFTLLTLASVCALQTTDYAIGFAEIASGFTFQLPSEGWILIAAIGAFGITGVGGDEIMTYNYWLLEKGYAAKTGPRDDSEAWTRRAKGWINVMYWDAIVSMVVYTVVTAAFYILGAAVLHAKAMDEADKMVEAGEITREQVTDKEVLAELIPANSDLVGTLGNIYTETLGPWAQNVFLAGAFIVLFSTLFAALAGWTRLYSDCFGRMGAYDFDDPVKRRKWVAGLAWAIPALWAFAYLFVGFVFGNSPATMVFIGGVATSVILLIVVVAAMHFRYRRLPESLRPGRVYDVFLWLSATVIVGAAIYALVVKLIS